jgi:hypothetical protein
MKTRYTVALSMLAGATLGAAAVQGGRPVGGLQHLASLRIAHPRGYAATRAAAMAAFGKSWRRE